MPEKQDRHPRSHQARAYQWAWTLITVSLEMVLPGVAGHLLLDRWLGTVCVFTLIGFAGGMTIGLCHLIKFARNLENEEAGSGKPVDRG